MAYLKCINCGKVKKQEEAKACDCCGACVCSHCLEENENTCCKCSEKIKK